MSYGEPLTNIGTDIWDFTEFVGRDSVDLLARMIYSEARGEPWAGKQGVAYVAKNRKDNGSWGNTYAEVLLARYQFEGMTEETARCPDITHPDTSGWTDCLYIAENLSSQYNPIGNRMYFLPYTPPSNAVDILQIGSHYFFNY